MIDRWLADLVLVVHLAYLAFIPIGGFLAWRCRWVMWPHLAAVAVGFVSVTVGLDCPLTSWEQSLRRRGGERAYRDGFIDHYLTGHVYPHGYDWLVQVLFISCVVVAYAVLIARHTRARRPLSPVH